MCRVCNLLTFQFFEIDFRHPSLLVLVRGPDTYIPYLLCAFRVATDALNFPIALYDRPSNKSGLIELRSGRFVSTAIWIRMGE